LGGRPALPQRSNAMFATTGRNVMYIGFLIIGLALVFVLLYFVVNSRRDTSPTRR
jgi:hypothetical protein